jgi:hypothetical protein
MPILSKFVYTWPNGTTPIAFDAWIKTLSTEEQDEFQQADIRQKDFRKSIVNQGNLKVTDAGYVWKDKDTLNIGKPTDPTWQIYWTRWINETGVIFTIEQIET